VLRAAEEPTRRLVAVTAGHGRYLLVQCGVVDDQDRAHDDRCPGMWRLTGAVLDEELGAVTEYVCQLCGGQLAVPPGGVHPPEA
jgi:hypothetical protein